MNDGPASRAFGDLIRTHREAKGWSQEQLEQATTDENGGRVSVSTISRWERGQAGRPEPVHVRSVCKALNIDPRLAAVALGYLTADELGEPPQRKLDPSVEEVLRILEDPDVPDEEKDRWIDYLKFLQDRYRRARRSQAI